MPGHRFVDRVVDDLVDEVVQSGLSRRADIHPRPSANSLNPLQHIDVGGVVAANVPLAGRLVRLLVQIRRRERRRRAAAPTVQVPAGSTCKS